MHGEPWSSRLSVRASSQPSPSLNGESDGYSLFFFSPSLAGCVSASLTQTCAFAVSTCRHLITWLCCGSVFAGSLGISRKMEGLVSEVSIITEAVKDSAPSWPLAQLHHHTVWRYSALWMCGLFLKKIKCISRTRCTAVPCGVRLLACVHLAGVWTRLAFSPLGCVEVHTSFSNGWVHHASLSCYVVCNCRASKARLLW